MLWHKHVKLILSSNQIGMVLISYLSFYKSYQTCISLQGSYVHLLIRDLTSIYDEFGMSF